MEEHYIILGSKGAIYKDTFNALQLLGLDKARALTLMRSLNTHAINWLATVVRRRRQEEPNCSAATHPRGVG